MLVPASRVCRAAGVPLASREWVGKEVGVLRTVLQGTPGMRGAGGREGRCLAAAGSSAPCTVVHSACACACVCTCVPALSTAPAPPPPRPTGTAARAFVWRAHDGARTRCEGGRASQPWAGRASGAAEHSPSAGLRCSCVFAGGQPLLAGHDAHFAPISVGAPQHVAPQAHEADYDMVPASPVSSPPASHHRMSRGRARQPEPARGARSARPAATLPLSSPAHAYRRRCVVHAPRHGRIRALCS